MKYALLRQRGLASWVVVAVVVFAGLAMAFAYPKIRSYQRTIDLRSAANEQSAVTTSLFNFMAKNSVKLQSILSGSTGITVACGSVNCVNPLAPTAAELRADGYTNVPSSALLGGAYQLQIATGPGGMEGRVTRTGPITVAGSTQLDLTAASVVTRFIMASTPTLSNSAGWSTSGTPTVINGPQGSWSRANPIGQAGVVMVVTQLNNATMAQYCAQGGNCNFNNVTATGSSVKTGTVGNLTSTTANAQTLSGQTLAYNSGTVTSLTGNKATITNITGNLNGNATTSTSTSYASLAGKVPCSGVTGSTSNLCNIQPGTCANGATNPPTCNVFPPCANGATNPPACNVFPPCTNGATNPPVCDNNTSSTGSCANGATDYPVCTPPSTGSCTYGGNTYPNGYSNGPYLVQSGVSFGGQLCDKYQTLTCVSGSMQSSYGYQSCSSGTNTCSNGATNYPACDNNMRCFISATSMWRDTQNLWYEDLNLANGQIGGVTAAHGGDCVGYQYKCNNGTAIFIKETVYIVQGCGASG